MLPMLQMAVEHTAKGGEVEEKKGEGD